MSKKQHCVFFLLACIIVMSEFSCSFDYNKAELAEGLDSDIPDIQLIDASLTYVRGTIVVIDSKSLNIYSDYDRYDVDDITFREMDKSGEIRILGKANQASINTQNNNVKLTGDIWIRSHKDEAEIKTSSIEWKDKERLIEGGKNNLLIINRDDGSLIQGYGFVGDADSRNLFLKQKVVGELVVEEAEEAEEEEEEEELDEDKKTIFSEFDERKNPITKETGQQDIIEQDSNSDTPDQNNIDIESKLESKRVYDNEMMRKYEYVV